MDGPDIDVDEEIIPLGSGGSAILYYLIARDYDDYILYFQLIRIEE